MILIFDTETTGLPKDWKSPVTDVDNWPRIVQLAFSTYQTDGTLIEEIDLIVKPDGFEIPAEASAIHGISQERALKEGIPIRKALDMFIQACERSTILVAHNLKYDHSITAAEMIRLKLKAKNLIPVKICTKEGSTRVCKLPNAHKWQKGYKWPKLEELYHFLFKEDFPDAHNALGDVRATARAFFELVARGDIILTKSNV